MKSDSCLVTNQSIAFRQALSGMLLEGGRDREETVKCQFQHPIVLHYHLISHAFIWLSDEILMRKSDRLSAFLLNVIDAV